MSQRQSFLSFLVRAIALLPFWLLYGKGSLLALLAGNVLRYRRDIVTGNLRRSFRQASAREVARWRKAFYRNLSDILVEIIKASRISRQELERRVQIEDLRLLEDLLNDGKSIVLVCGHRGNWEWAAMTLSIRLNRVAAVYKPLSNQGFDRLMLGIRGRFGMELLAMNSVARHVATHKEAWVRIFVADQSPPKHEIRHYTEFLGQDTPVYLGPARLAQAAGHAMVFMDILREGRGHYRVSFREVPIEDGDSETLLTERYTRMLEEGIRRQPDNWLWSHRRWKHTRRNGTGD